MGVYPDWMIRRWVREGGIRPFDSEGINSASVDLRMGSSFIDLVTGRRFEASEVEIRPGDAILATTIEYIRMPPGTVGTIYVKSSLARQGLGHISAGFVDPGFSGEITMVLHSHRPITLRAEQRIVQLKIEETKGIPHELYQGKYQGQRGPTPAREEDEG